MSTPKEQFLETLKPEENFRGIVLSSVFQRAITYSLAEFVSLKPAPNEDELRGANRFLDIFKNIAEPGKKPARFPDETSAGRFTSRNEGRRKRW